MHLQHHLQSCQFVGMELQYSPALWTFRGRSEVLHQKAWFCKVYIWLRDCLHGRGSKRRAAMEGAMEEFFVYACLKTADQASFFHVEDLH